MYLKVNTVMDHYGVSKYVGVGVGLGANVLIRHALTNPERVDCLLVINAVWSAPGWIEWGYQKRNLSHLRRQGVTQAVLDYLMWHHFGDNAAEGRAIDLTNVYMQHFSLELKAANLAKLIEQYNWRSAIAIERVNGLEPFKSLKVS